MRVLPLLLLLALIHPLAYPAGAATTASYAGAGTLWRTSEGETVCTMAVGAAISRLPDAWVVQSSPGEAGPAGCPGALLGLGGRYDIETECTEWSDRVRCEDAAGCTTLDFTFHVATGLAWFTHRCAVDGAVDRFLVGLWGTRA